jgi:PKD repeat protein
MNAVNRSWLILLMIFLIFSGSCSSKPPVVPDSLVPDINSGTNWDSPHKLIATGYIAADYPDNTLTIIPARGMDFHINTTYFLEKSPCANCLNLENINYLGSSEWIFDMVITHPMPEGETFTTAFDFRAVMMFDPTGVFPEMGLLWPDPEAYSGALLNADGYTTLFNPIIFSGTSPFFNYYSAKFSTSPPNSTLNPYKNFFIPTERKYLLPGEKAYTTMQIRIPGASPRIGYAIDACWTPPEVNPPVNIPDDFSLSSNMPEAYSVVVNLVKNTLYYQDSVNNGGDLDIEVRVGDWQGAQPYEAGGSVNRIRIDIPGLLIIEDDNLDDWEFDYNPLPSAVYSYHLNPALNCIGEFPLLVAVEDIEPGLLAGTKATAYQIITFGIGSDPVNLPPVADLSASNPLSGPVPFNPTLDPSMSHDPDGTIVSYEWDLDYNGTYELKTANPSPFGWVFSVEGYYPVRLRVTDNPGLTDEAIMVFVAGPPENAPPVADLSLTAPVSGSAPLNVTLNGSLSNDSDGTIVLWEWDVNGDGIYDYIMSSQANIVYKYQNPGDVTLRLRVTDDDGAVGSDETTIQVY